MATNKDSKTKVGPYPLQKVATETRPGSYESNDYLYDFPTGFVWMRTIHDLSSGEHRLQLEFVHRGFKYSCWLPPLVVAYTDRMLCQAAREFAKQKTGEVAKQLSAPAPTQWAYE